MTATVKLSKAQETTLRTLIRNGGEMNGFAGQKGFYCNSEKPLERMGLIERIPSCDTCTRIGYYKRQCEWPLVGQRNGDCCYDRVRIIDVGRVATA